MTDRQTSTSTYRTGPTPTATTTHATTSTSRARTRLATSSTCRRRQRSSSTPANGPTSVYGTRAAVNAHATAEVVAARSGEKNTSEARPTWNAPSPACEASRVPSSRRYPLADSTSRSAGQVARCCARWSVTV